LDWFQDLLRWRGFNLKKGWPGFLIWQKKVLRLTEFFPGGFGRRLVINYG